MRVLPGFRTAALALCLAAVMACAAHAAPRTDPRLAAPGGSDEEFLAAYSQASADWGDGVEATIEEAYRKCFRTYIISGRVITLHLPFAENNERSELAGSRLSVEGGGKADPLALWDQIDTIIASPDFSRYAAELSDGHEKVLSFDLTARTWSASRDWYAIDQMKAGSYPGLPHRPTVLASGKGLTPPDVYNYLYGVGRLGMDCSGFVWHVLTTVAKTGGLDLNKALRRYLGAPSAARASLFIGTWFFDPRNRNLITVKDEIRNLRPCDVLVFRGDGGLTTHSAIIQSIDMKGGTIRYLQSTDNAEQDDRGVHESLITFDPGKPQTSLKDPSLVWHQRRTAAFTGEEAGVEFWDDGERYRAFPEFGGGAVVRLKAMQKLMARFSTAR
ncbi:MAG: peptidoglycan endopeptidase [Spirochaetia bacterium]